MLNENVNGQKEELSKHEFGPGVIRELATKLYESNGCI